MKVKNDGKISLYMECFLLIIIAGMVSLLFFMSSRFLAEQKIEKYYKNRNIVQSYNENYMMKLQEYINEYDIASDHLDKLDEWMDDHRQVYIQMKKDDEWICSSDDYMDGTQVELYDLSEYPEDSYFTVQLSDISVQVFIMGMYLYNAYMIALVIEIALCGNTQKW